MNPEPPERRTTPIPPRPHARPPQRPPAQPPGPPAQPWYLEFRRPQAQPPRIPPPPAQRPPSSGPRPARPQRPPAAPPAKRAFGSNRGLLIGAGVTGLLALALLALVVRMIVGDTGPVELDVTHAQDGVRQVLTDPVNGYGRDAVTAVACNNGVNPRVRRGATFSCVVTVDGAQRQVLVEFADDAGTYLVDRPR